MTEKAKKKAYKLMMIATLKFFLWAVANGEIATLDEFINIVKGVNEELESYDEWRRNE